MEGDRTPGARHIVSVERMRSIGTALLVALMIAFLAIALLK